MDDPYGWNRELRGRDRELELAHSDRRSRELACPSSRNLCRRDAFPGRPALGRRRGVGIECKQSLHYSALPAREVAASLQVSDLSECSLGIWPECPRPQP